MSEHQPTDFSLPPAGRTIRHLGFSPLVQSLVAVCEQEEEIIAALCRAATNRDWTLVQSLAVELAALCGNNSLNGNNRRQ